MSKEKDESLQNKNPLTETFNQLDVFLDYLFQPSTLKPIFDQVEQLFQETLSIPHISIDSYETTNEYVIIGKLPGIRKEQIVIDIFERYLTVKVDHHETSTSQLDEHNFFQKISQIGNFSKTFLLPIAIEESDLRASFQNDELKIVIPLNKKGPE